MLHINDNRVCPKCGAYRASRKVDGKAICASGHVVDLNKYITLKEYVKSSERRNPDIHRSSTVHYPDWDRRNKKYITRKRKVGKLNKGETTS